MCGDSCRQTELCYSIKDSYDHRSTDRLKLAGGHMSEHLDNNQNVYGYTLCDYKPGAIAPESWTTISPPASTTVRAWLNDRQG